MRNGIKDSLKCPLGINRLEAFSDGVFAVAITLLIFEVRIPELLPQSSLWLALAHITPQLLTYVMSFALVGIFWVGHQLMFRYIVRADRILLSLNLLLLMFISAIPFSAAAIGNFPEHRGIVAMYGALLTLAGISFLAVWLYASLWGNLVDERTPRRLRKIGTSVIALAPCLYLLGIVLVFVDPLISKIVYFITPIVYLLPGPIDELVEYSAPEDE